MDSFETGTKRHFRFSINVRMSITIIVFGIIAYLAFASVAVQIASWIYVGELEMPSDAHADLIIVLGGNTLERMVRGVELYNQRVAPQIALTGYDPREPESEVDVELIARHYAIQEGVSESDFSLLSTASTYEDAEQIRNYVSQYGIRRLVVVSDWTHGRRAICSIRAANTSSSLTLYFAATPSDFTPINWWLSNDGAESIFSEVIKMVFYTLRYGIPMWGCFPGDPDLSPYPFLLGFVLLLCFIYVRRGHKTAHNYKQMNMPKKQSLTETGNAINLEVE